MSLGALLAAVVLAAPATASSGHFAYSLSLNSRLSGGLVLHAGDRVVCENPARWLIVTVPRPSTKGIMRAARQIRSGHAFIRLTLTKSLTSGRGVLTCTRFRQ
jgi:hypothetical protein